MGYIGNALNPKRSEKTESSLFHRTQWDYCDHCYFTYQLAPMSKTPTTYTQNRCYGPLRFCVHCGWRYLVFKAAMQTKFPEITVESLTEQRTLRLHGHTEWIDFVIKENMGLIMAAWASFDETVRSLVDDVDQRPLEEQLCVTVGARKLEVVNA
jgi:hypothetical protein